MYQLQKHQFREDVGFLDSFFNEKCITYFDKIKTNLPKIIEGKEILFFFPCARSKPIQNSPSHCYLSPMTRWNHPKIAKFIISEPLTMIPYEDFEYPHYNYPPHNLNETERNEFISRLKELFAHINLNIHIFYIGSKHHFSILKEAGITERENFYYRIPKYGIRDYSNEAKKFKEFIEKKCQKILIS